MKKGSCPKCGSTKVIADATVLDRSPYNDKLTVQTDTRPLAILFKGTRKSHLSAWVCGECGYTELYAETPETLLPEDQA